MEKLHPIFKLENNAGNTLKCTICKHYLSISPIVLNDTLGSICGRESCKKWAASEDYRQSAYEELAKFLKFPCMYKEDGCKKVLPWNEIGEHEIICEFMKLCCPFSTDYVEHTGEICTWEGNTSEILLHMEDNHSSHRFEKYVQISLEQDIKRSKLMFSRIQDSIVILLVVVHAESDTYWKVWTVPEMWKYFHYKIEITSEKGQSLSESKLQTAELLHPTFLKHKIDDSWFKINFDSIKSFFDSPYFLTTKFYVKGFLIGSPENLSCHDISSSLPTTKCDKCKKQAKKYMFVCRGDEKVHTICDNCRKSDRYCPIDESHLDRNFAADKFKAFLNHAFKSCILCEAKVQCLSSHLSNSHSEFIFILGECHNFSMKYYFFSFDDHIFLLSRKIVPGSNLTFSVQCLETRTVKYKYELKLMNSKTSSTANAIAFTDFCHPELIDFEYIDRQNSKSLTHETSIPHILYTSIFPRVDSIKFKLNIFKM